jgi:hypothetical protein
MRGFARNAAPIASAPSACPCAATAATAATTRSPSTARIAASAGAKPGANGSGVAVAARPDEQHGAAAGTCGVLGEQAAGARVVDGDGRRPVGERGDVGDDADAAPDGRRGDRIDRGRSKAAIAIALKPPSSPVQRRRFATWASTPAASSLKVTAAPTAAARAATSRRTSSIGAYSDA